MNLLRTIISEAIAIFIDDGAFAAGIVIWLAVVAALARFAPAFGAWDGLLLFAGLATILAESAIRRSRK